MSTEKRPPTPQDERAILLAARLMEKGRTRDDGLLVQQLWSQRRFLADVLRTVRDWDSIPAADVGNRDMETFIRDMLRSVGEE